MNKFIQDLFIPRNIKAFNNKLLHQYPLISIMKIIPLMWILLIILIGIAVLTYIMPISITSLYLNVINTTLMIGFIVIITASGLIYWYNWQSTYQRIEVTWKEKILLFFAELFIITLFTLIPLFAGIILNDKYKTLISDQEVAYDLASFNLVKNRSHFFSFDDPLKKSFEAVSSYRLRESISNANLDSLSKKRYETLINTFNSVSTDEDQIQLLRNEVIQLAAKYEIPYSKNVASNLSDRLDLLYIEKTRNPLLFSKYLIYLILILLILPQVSTYENPKKIFKIIGVTLLTLLLILALSNLLSYIFQNKNLAINLGNIKTGKILFATVVGIIGIRLSIDYFLKIRTKYTTDYIVFLHLFFYSFIVYTLLYELWILVIPITLLTFIMAHLGMHFNVLPLTQRSSKSFGWKEVVLKNKLSNYLIQNHPNIWDANFILALFTVSLVGGLSILYASNEEVSFSNCYGFSRGSLFLDIKLGSLFSLSIILMVTWIVYYTKKKINISLRNQYFFECCKIYLIIISILSGFYLSTYSYAYTRLNNIGEKYKDYELIEDVKTLINLDKYTKQSISFSDKTTVRNIRALQDSINEKTLMEWWHLDTVSSKSFSMDSVANLFRKYDISPTFEMDLLQLKEDENYINQRDSLNQYINYIIEVKHFREEEKSQVFSHFIAIFLMSFLVLLHKTSYNIKFTWVYVAFILMSIFTPYYYTSQKWISYNVNVILLYILTTIVLFFYGLIKKKRSITLQTYAMAIIGLQFIGYNIITMWASVSNLYYILGPVTLLIFFLLLNSYIQRRMLIKPFNSF